ncbi:hypothetical protein HPB47_006220 [Ixodes persulcatus]|uniref:Uncharacterized protein n=1 Tax=Ixodes persulcatus TaxID=34615 RepID=A0AC60PB09_IXOPE|nr:hypothetical protein HPB47_006220 [Ixodes persulcatus]
MDLPRQPEDEILQTGEAIALRPVPDSIDSNIRTDTSSAIEVLLDAHHQRTAQELRHFWREKGTLVAELSPGFVWTLRGPPGKAIHRFGPCFS